MNLRLDRSAVVDGALPGVLFVDGVRACCTLENARQAIPAGRYQIGITVSERVLMHDLWSPDAAYRLPLLLNVPCRSGIRMHAANEADQLEGCIALGASWSGSWLGTSQRTFAPIFAQLLAAADKHEQNWIEIRPADAPETRVV